LKKIIKEENQLYIWLKKRFKLDNHPKYLHYCDEWINNLTESQLEGFNKQRNTKL
jgi:hypothetical protein